MNIDLFLNSQPKVLKLINNSFKKNRLVHTYLFEGPRGTSKLEGAYYLAMKLLCKNKEKSPCFTCEDCKKVLNEVHPNIFYIEPINNMITKDQVEQISKEFSLTPLSDGVRVYIINEIDKANQSAANSLLKFFEELEGDKYGILLTENIEAVLPTIRSRSVVVLFDQLPSSLIKSELISKGVEEEVSSILAILTNSVTDSLDLIKEGVILDLIKLVQEITYQIVTKDSSPLIEFFEKGEFLLNIKDKKYHSLFLDLLITLSNDKLYYVLDQNEKIVFKNYISMIGPSIKNSYNKILDEIELLLDFKERLRYNINLELFYTQLIIEMMRYYG